MRDYESRLRDHVFDVLGDFVKPDDVLVMPDKRTGYRLVCVRTRGLPREFLWDEWRRQTKGTEFEGIPLYA